MRFVLATCVAAASFCGLASSAHATAVTLDFDQLDGKHGEVIASFYNGGKGSLGAGPGANYGITFDNIVDINGRGTPPIAFCSFTACGHTAMGGNTSGPNALLIFGTPDNFAGNLLNVAGGFSGTVEFDAAVVKDTRPLVKIKATEDDPSGLAELTITHNGTDPTGCPPPGLGVVCSFLHYALSFSGIAHTIVFNTSFQGDLFIDDLHFSDLILPSDAPPSDTPPDAVPEPASWTLMISGLGLLSVMLRRRPTRFSGSGRALAA